MTPDTLTYRFHKFRPSDRAALRDVANTDGNVDLLVSALRLYLGRWADADWLAEYDVERIACWCALHLPSASRKEIVKMARQELAASVTEQANRVYRHFLEEFERNLNGDGIDETTGNAINHL